MDTSPHYYAEKFQRLYNDCFDRNIGTRDAYIKMTHFIEIMRLLPWNEEVKDVEPFLTYARYIGKHHH